MDDVIMLIAKAITSGGISAIICLLSGFIFYLLLNIRSLNKNLDAKDKKLEELIVESNKLKDQLNSTLMDLRLTIAEINAKISNN